jgi:hypothetical protein
MSTANALNSKVSVMNCSINDACLIPTVFAISRPSLARVAERAVARIDEIDTGNPKIPIAINEKMYTIPMLPFGSQIRTPSEIVDEHRSAFVNNNDIPRRFPENDPRTFRALTEWPVRHSVG